VVDALRRQYRRIARERPYVHLVDAAGPLGGPDGEWIGYLPGEEQPIRTGDAVHLAPHGQRLLAQAIAPVVRQVLG
jgi:lysophospholipase L1-like esterase